MAAAWIVLATGIASGEVLDRVVAAIDGDPITASELERFGKERHVEEATQQQVLDVLITEKLLAKEIESKGVTVRKEDVEAYIEQVRQRSGMDEAAFDAALAERGLSKDAYRANVEVELQKSQLINREIRGRLSVTDEDIERYYQAHRGDFATGGKVSLQAIVLGVDQGWTRDQVMAKRQLAEDIRNRLVEGADFEAMAREHSEGPGGDRGGHLGTFEKGQLEPALEKIVFGLERGEVSDVVATPAGFSIFRLDSVESDDDGELDDATRERIREKLYDQALQARFDGWLTRDLREHHHVEVLD